MSDMELAPIVVFAYNRPDHLRRTLDALSKNELAKDSVLFVYCDGPKAMASSDEEKNENVQRSAQRFFKGSSEDYKEYRHSIEQCVELAQSQAWPKELHVISHENNWGLAKSIVGAVTEIVNRYGKVITLEDDIVTSKGFLRYMNDALELYKDEDKVMHISAYMFPHKKRLPQTFFYPVPYPGGGWATWKRAWAFYNDNTKELYDYWSGRWDEFDVNGGTLYRKQLEDNLSGRMSTWFVKWHAVVLQRKGLTLYPGKSLTTNIGFDSSATNCSPTNRYYIYVLADSITVKKSLVKENKKCGRVIYDFYQGHWYNKRRRHALICRITSKLFFWRQ